MFLCDWLLPLSILSKFIHVVACVSSPFLFLWLNNILLYGYTTFIYPFISWWIFILFSLLAIGNKVLWIFVYFFGVDMFSFLMGMYPGLQLDHIVTLCLTIWGTAGMFSKAAALFYIAISSMWGFQFLHVLDTHFVVSLFECGHPRGYKVLFHYCFDLHFPHG